MYVVSLSFMGIVELYYCKRVQIDPAWSTNRKWEISFCCFHVAVLCFRPWKMGNFLWSKGQCHRSYVLNRPTNVNLDCGCEVVSEFTSSLIVCTRFTISLHNWNSVYTHTKIQVDILSVAFQFFPVFTHIQSLWHYPFNDKNIFFRV
jgi:hypothetical protein